VTLAEVRALRGVLDERRQLFVACSANGGVEVLPLEQIEKRCENGWSGILLAEAGDLPSALIEPALTQLGETSAGDSGDTRERYVHPREKEFGEHLGADAGMSVLHGQLGGRDDGRLERDLRVLALARGMSDLRQLDGEYDSRSLVPWAVWRALVTDAHINLQPFRATDSEEPGEDALGLPIGPLANVQIYTTNADPGVEGKGHSPFCRHARGNYEGITRGYDLVTVADLLRGPEPDWCSQCGGYALRRLNSTEVEYYRVAHILLDTEQELTQELYTRGGRRIDLAAMRAGLSDASQWLRGGSYPGPLRAGDAWRVQDAIRNLQEKAERINRYHQDGWPDDGTVIHLSDRRDASHPSPTNGKGNWRRSLFANLKAHVLESPVGTINDGEESEVAALRELEEETGYLWRAEAGGAPWARSTRCRRRPTLPWDRPGRRGGLGDREVLRYERRLPPRRRRAIRIGPPSRAWRQ